MCFFSGWCPPLPPGTPPHVTGWVWPCGAARDGTHTLLSIIVYSQNGGLIVPPNFSEGIWVPCFLIARFAPMTEAEALS
jgi:hypothetical protein